MVRARTESTLSVVSEASTVSVPSARERSLSNLFGGGAEEEDVDQAPLKPLKAPAADTATWDARDVRVAMIGNVDSGKSTLIGVLTAGGLDDGRGGARSLVLRHKHEQENGRTSTVSVELMGFQGERQVLPTARQHAQRWKEVVDACDRNVSLIDLCGHERYLKTTVFGGAGKECEIPNFKGSYLGRFPLVSADFWTSDHLSEQSRSVDAFSGTRARGTLTSKRR